MCRPEIRGHLTSHVIQTASVFDQRRAYTSSCELLIENFFCVTASIDDVVLWWQQQRYWRCPDLVTTATPTQRLQHGHYLVAELTQFLNSRHRFHVERALQQLLNFVLCLRSFYFQVKESDDGSYDGFVAATTTAVVMQQQWKTTYCNCTVSIMELVFSANFIFWKLSFCWHNLGVQYFLETIVSSLSVVA